MNENTMQNNGEKPMEKFPKVNTVPLGWDQSVSTTTSASLVNETEVQTISSTTVKPMEKFPRMNTIPRGWDLSENTID